MNQGTSQDIMEAVYRRMLAFNLELGTKVVVAFSGGNDCRVTRRRYASPGSAQDHVGFRYVWEP